MVAIARLAALMGLASIAALGAGMLLEGASMKLLLLLPTLALLLLSIRSGLRWSSSLWLFVQIGIAAGTGTAAPFAILAAGMALGYWDLEHFGRRLASAKNVARHRQFVQRHLRLLLGSLATGCILAILVSASDFQIGFLAAAISAVALGLGLGYLLRRPPADELP